MTGGIIISLQEKVLSLPSSPGVYLMKDSGGYIIYVGKAKNLKKRVQTYFHNSKSHTQKTKKLVSTIKDFDIIKTDTEFEAFMLECSLIQEIKPHYNRKMKNPKAYSYIMIDNGSNNQKIKITSHRNQENDHQYFGPYTSKSTTEKAILAIKDFYHINCSNPSKNKTACLNYSLGLCIGMCLGGPATVEYDRIINKVIALLNGTDMSILNEMELKMNMSSEQFDFETAGKYRDSIQLIKFLINREKIIEFTEGSKNIAVIEFLSETTFKLFLIKRNKILFSEKYDTNNMGNEEIHTEIRGRFLTYFKTTTSGNSQKINQNEIDEAQIIYSYLKSSTSHYIIIPEEWSYNELDITVNQFLEKNVLKPLNV
jgi:excinuclease ABC subunit C